MNLNPSLGLNNHGVNVVDFVRLGSWGKKRKSVVVESPVQLGLGRIDSGQIGAFTYTGHSSYYLHVNSIGRFCALGPSVVTGYAEHPTESLTPHPMFSGEFDKTWKAAKVLYDDPEFTKVICKKMDDLTSRKGQIDIGNDVWIGNGAYIAREVKIGDGAIVGARAVVIKDVPPYTVVGGVAAKTIKQRFSDKIVERLLELKWWDYGPAILKGVDITNIESTIYEIESRISKGFSKYNPDKIEFDLAEDAIYGIPSATSEKILIHDFTKRMED
ncbi:CatB-related O-acetyltransferase [Paenibacillus macerans]|uniref:Bacterial transferase hexapeptide family protein n=1 Tax=Paenibacillus macerans TaxID=44252 RepID=A0A090ZIK0_PAEMA|nr:CatB-related O-acetyltransferase [Paenibacillus macerans]KFN11149.1 bacterial transferase hexapeptide family protein [Paenibacillus macerans]MCY7560207.1 CatB-related O-acetyltransferase [Paenibacillus macerans]MEC0151261.1 CatB-related O-acetyltransferase [Paenibacillus macerans]SUD26835.1 transferase [Paenibacillus macerans]